MNAKITSVNGQINIEEFEGRNYKKHTLNCTYEYNGGIYTSDLVTFKSFISKAVKNLPLSVNIELDTRSNTWQIKEIANTSGGGGKSGGFKGKGGGNYGQKNMMSEPDFFSFVDRVWNKAKNMAGQDVASAPIIFDKVLGVASVLVDFKSKGDNTPVGATNNNPYPQSNQPNAGQPQQQQQQQQYQQQQPQFQQAPQQGAPSGQPDIPINNSGMPAGFPQQGQQQQQQQQYQQQRGNDDDIPF